MKKIKNIIKNEYKKQTRKKERIKRNINKKKTNKKYFLTHKIDLYIFIDEKIFNK